MKLAVFDVGGTEIKYALIEDALTIKDKGNVPTPRDSFSDFADVVFNIYQKYKDEVDGIAMSLPGFIDVEKGRCNGGGALRYNHGTDVGRLLSERCGCKVVLENDGKAAIQAEFYKGALQGCKNAAVFVIGTAVGGGLIVNGDIVRGSHFTAGEFSFVATEPDGFEEEGNLLGFKCSTRHLLDLYCQKTGVSEEIDGREFFRRYPNDPYAKEALDELCNIISSSTGSLLNAEKIANTFASVRHEKIDKATVEKYIGYFKDAFLIREAKRYDLKGRKEIGALRKYYFCDTGLRNARLNFAFPDEGQMLENIVYNELCYHGYSVNVGAFDTVEKDANHKSIRKNNEVDFYATKGRRAYYIQVTADISNADTRDREIRPYLKLNDQIKKVLVINKPISETYDENGFTIIGIADFLLRFIK